MEPPQREEASPQLAADEDVTQSVGQITANQLGAQIHGHSQDQRTPWTGTDGWAIQQQWSRSFQPEFQDSNLSPALSLLPVNSGEGHNLTEYSLFQQSDTEFAPLRAYPDISMASERFPFPPQDRTHQASERGSLSQHPLAQATILSEEGMSSGGSLSMHSLTLEGRQDETDHTPLIATIDRQAPSRDDASSREKDVVMLTDSPDKPVGEAAKDETLFLSKALPAQHLLELLQKDIGMPSSNSSAVSSASGASVKAAASFAEESKSSKVCKPDIDQSLNRREGPPGEASLPLQQTQQPDRDLCPDQSQTLLSEACNITTGHRSTEPDESSEVLRRELLSEVERCSSGEAKSKNAERESPAPSGPSLTPYPTGMSEGKPSVTRSNLGGLQWTGRFLAGVKLGYREQDLTGIDGSYLGFLPQSQSTPGVFKAPPKSSVKTKLGQLSAIESNKENSYESNTRISPQPAAPEADVHRSDAATPRLAEATSARVQSLPSLNYMQKVDAWQANQSSSKTSLFDSLALQGFSGISPKKKAYDAVSEPLNRILSQQVRSLQQPPVSGAAHQDVTQSFSTAPCGSSARRGEAVGSAPSDNDNTGSGARPSASPFGRSQSHSSLNTVVMSAKKDRQKEIPAEEENSPFQEDVAHHQPNATVQPSPRVSLAQFSDVSLDRDLTLSSSQDSYNSGIKVGTSIGASSVVSLEVDNYAPYWTSKLSTPPPRPRELNIEERIPLYLRNLGIDQSPSTILTPFAPRGPIREPEFSPTDLCTIKGTPTKSTQPSEGGSPHKREFSRCSVLSLDSSISIRLSLDSLGPGVSIPEQPRRASPSSDTESLHSECRLAPSSLTDEDSYPSTQQQHMDSSLTGSQNTSQLRDRFESDLSLPTKSRCADREFELQTGRSCEQSVKDSLVSSKDLLEIHKPLSQAENVLSVGSTETSSDPPAVPRLLSDDDIFLSLKGKTDRLQGSSFFSSSATEDPRTQPSLQWARSSSDSMLASEKLRENSIGRESVTSSGRPNYPLTQALITVPATGAYRRQQDSTFRGGAGSSLVQSVRRAEPEGCSAAAPDNTVPPQPPVSTSPVLSIQPLTSSPTDTAGVTEEEKLTILEGLVQNSPSPPPHHLNSSPTFQDSDQGGMSDGSSESSLALRVAKLLQSEYPGTMVSSTPSTIDQEDSKGREWIKQRESLELDKEDRKRTEEIRRELLLKYPIKSQGSTESSATSSIGVQREQNPSPPAETFNPLGAANNQPFKPIQGLSTDLSGSSVQLQNPPRPDLEAQIREIAAREGVTLPRTNPQALTSITIATRRRSTSPSPSTSPAPPLSPVPELLALAELSAGAVGLPARQLPPMDEEDEAVFDPSGSLDTTNQNLTSLSPPGNQKRQEAVGGQFEEPPPPSQGLGSEDVNATEENTQYFSRDYEISIQDSAVYGASHEAEQIRGSSTSEFPARTGHVSHVHLTLSPKATDHSLATAVLSSHADAVTGLPHKEFVSLRPSSPAACSPDEGVGLSSPPEWCGAREPITRRVVERPETSTLFRSSQPQGKKTAAATPSFTPRHRVVSPRPFTTAETPVPVLLPYKPRGSEELFYVPQTEVDISTTDHSDTTMESSHTGSDDAVPPRFSSEVLGQQDAGLDRGVTIRHLEGIYSKRLKKASFKMQEPRHRADEPSQTSVPEAPKPSSQVSVAFTRVPLSNSQGASKRDPETGPVQFPAYEPPQSSRVRVQPVHVDVDYDKTSSHLDQSSVPPAGGEQQHPTQQSSSTLDQLWERFCDRWTVEESHRVASLLERLERLSRLIQGTRSTYMSERGNEKLQRRGEKALGKERKKDFGKVMRSVGGESREMERLVRGGGEVEGEPSVSHQATTQRIQVAETSQPADEDSFTSSLSLSQHLCAVDRDQSETLSTMSGAVSTVDTARLVRAFGAHRVQHLKTNSDLSKLYRAINQQKEGREQRRGRNKETDESSVAADSITSTSSYALPPHSGPSRTLAAKKAVKLVSTGIQAGHLEIVCNGTRRNTRDVGTTFPSPDEARTAGQISSSSSSLERGRGGWRSPSKSQGLQKQRKSKRSPWKAYPEGVSWFISADDLRSEARKENQPEEEESRRPSNAWFSPYSRMNPRREPLRQRQVHEDRNQHHAETGLDPRTKTPSSGLAQISLQEALELHRPEFISHSRQRVERLALQVEERKLQEVFRRERNELFSRPRGGPVRLPRPAGSAQLRRAVPRKEMIQRSKQLYENLPEVQRRREEERRKAEYQSYRLNARLYNKRVTNRLLGRRTASNE